MAVDSFLGVGLGKALAMAFFTMIIIVAMKVITTRYPVSGLTEFINAI